jgi:hypothetical protein
MKLILQENLWTCHPAAVATHLGCTLSQMFEHLGHDGSEIVDIDSPDPLGRRGFHPQEFIELANRLCEYSVTQIDLFPAAQSDCNAPIKYFKTILGEDCEQRFDRNLKHSFGWIDCRTRRGTGHALAYDYATLGDPATGETFTYQSRQDAESRGLYFVSLFRLDFMEKFHSGKT